MSVDLIAELRALGVGKSSAHKYGKQFGGRHSSLPKVCEMLENMAKQPPCGRLNAEQIQRYRAKADQCEPV